jgi:CMP-N-acetylneuraminic acid synthetase
VIRGVPEIDRGVVSTDHEGIAEAARGAGLAVPFMRPAAISGDCVGDWDVLIHALEATESIDKEQYGIVVMLQPTSPMRTSLQVSEAIRMLVDGRWDSVWTVSPTDSKAHPLKQLRVKGAAIGYYHPDGAEIVARQQLEPLYHRNGVAYVMTRNCLVKQRTIMGFKAGALVTEGECISIDTEHDLAAAAAMMKSKLMNR